MLLHPSMKPPLGIPINGLLFRSWLLTRTLMCSPLRRRRVSAELLHQQVKQLTESFPFAIPQLTFAIQFGQTLPNFRYSSASCNTHASRISQALMSLVGYQHIARRLCVCHPAYFLDRRLGLFFAVAKRSCFSTCASNSADHSLMYPSMPDSISAVAASSSDGFLRVGARTIFCLANAFLGTTGTIALRGGFVFSALHLGSAGRPCGESPLLLLARVHQCGPLARRAIFAFAF